MEKKIQVGIIGFGLSGRYFFAPYISQHAGFNLRGFVSSQKELIQKNYPNAQVFRRVDEMIQDASLDLIIVASPNPTHFKYAQKALQHHKHVIVEKPFTPTPHEAQALIDLAKAKKRLVIPFQNRRWDSDFLTVQKIIANNELGELLEFESHFDRFRPLTNRVQWKNELASFGGVLYDLGPHLIDQALVQFGMPQKVFADVRTQRATVETEDYFDIHLFYPNLKVILKAGVFIPEDSPRFIIRGRKGSFVKYGLDPQENNLKEGMLPDNPIIGKENKDIFGKLYLGDGEKMSVETYPSEEGNYSMFFENVYDAIYGKTELVVKPEQALQTVTILNLAFESSKLKKVLDV